MLCNIGKGWEGSGMAMASAGVEIKVFIPMKLPIFREAHIKAMAVI